MTTTMITAVYENGLLRPLTPLALPEHTRVQAGKCCLSPVKNLRLNIAAAYTKCWWQRA